MNSGSPDYQKLNLLADEKIKKLISLLNSLEQYYNDLENNSGEEILTQIDRQDQYLQEIKNLDQQYLLGINSKDMQFSLTGNRTLDAKLNEQKKIIEKIVSLNKKTMIKTEKISAELKDKIINIRQQKNIIINYHAKIEQTGNLFDFKEGK